MTRIDHKSNPAIYLSIVVTMACVLIGDYHTPRGIAVWVLYMIPVGLSLFTWRPQVPIAVALVATALIILTFFTDAAGLAANLTILNRTFGLITIWSLALIGYRFIQNRITVASQIWLQSSHTQLNHAIEGDQPLDQLGQNVLKLLAELLDAHAGAFYVDDGTRFARAATYAVPAGSNLPEYFAAGEGLLGQAAKDARTFIIRDMPGDYFAIGSALGKTAPRHLLVSPMIVDGAVAAVIELSFIHPIHEIDPQLLDRIGESVAVAVRSSQYRTRLKTLLEETQRQGEELQAQSEELRVTNEELAEQSRAIHESQARLELQQAELEQTNSQLEEQAQLLENQKSDLSLSKTSLEAQARELERASQYKSDFLSNMSHELRTPLNSSLILAKLLGDNRTGNLTPEQVKYANTIQAAGNDLLSLITDILDLSKIEAGRMEVRPEKVRLTPLVESLSRLFEPIAAQKSIQFFAHVEPGVPDSVETDSQRLEQVLKNLLSNALKFTEKGDVRLTVTRDEQSGIAFVVSDTGIGIPPDHQGMIFEAFRQADSTTNRKYGGTGLGLSISREFMRLLGGEITLVSQAGQGSTFTARLPLVYTPQQPTATRYAPHPSAGPSSSGASADARFDVPTPRLPVASVRVRKIEDDREHLTGNSRVILVIEDDEPFSRILYDLAHELNFQCLLASTAEDGQVMAAQYSPSAIVLDVGLPDRSGLSVLDKLKRDARTRHIPVHVVSANDYAKTAFSLGAIGYMLKPVKREDLAQAFERLETRLTKKLRRVLVVEDDAVQLESLRELLGSRDVETVGAQSAAECLEKLKSITFDCMVLDLSLPDASGFSLLKEISGVDTYGFPPVIIYTGRELTIDEEQQLGRYSKSIIIKGAKSPERLLDEVTLFLHQVVSELPVDKQKMIEKARNRDAAMEGRTILIVEDDIRNVYALTSLMEPQGVNIQIARNGREALKSLDESMNGHKSSIDLVLMDIMMPEMDGLTAMREIRKRPEWKKLPIIALTAKAMREDQDQCLNAGANDYIVKPLDVERLLSLVRVWMPRLEKALLCLERSKTSNCGCCWKPCIRNITTTSAAIPWHR